VENVSTANPANKTKAAPAIKSKKLTTISKLGKPEPRSTPPKPVKPEKAPVTPKPETPAKTPEKKEADTVITGDSKRVQESKEKAMPAPAIEPEKAVEPLKALRRNEKEQIVYLKLSDLHPFKAHPFDIRDDAEMKSLVESVKDNGVNTPALVRPIESGGYEIVAGHRRHKASVRAGFTELPCIIREMTDDEAILTMTDDNLQQRTEILPSERAKSLKMQFEAIKHQGVRFKDVASGDVGKRSSELVGDRNNMNSKQVQRYIRLNELEPDLIKAVDEKKLGFVSAVEISFISRKN